MLHGGGPQGWLRDAAYKVFALHLLLESRLDERPRGGDLSTDDDDVGRESVRQSPNAASEERSGGEQFAAGTPVTGLRQGDQILEIV